MYYTTISGSTPITTASTRYTGAITVLTSETGKAIAVAPGYANSAVSYATYTTNRAEVVRCTMHLVACDGNP